MRKAISAKYAALPPQMSIWNALRSGHFLLATVCLVALLANVLAVGLGGLFNEEPIGVQYSVDLRNLQSHEFELQTLPTFGSLNTDEVFFPLKANVTLGSSMTPWVSKEFYFQPFAAADPSPDNSTEIFQGRTRGYGIDITCSEYTDVTRYNTTDTLNYQHLEDRGQVDIHGLCGSEVNLTTNRFPTGRTSVEGAVNVCGQAMIFLWGRATKVEQTDREMKFLLCQQKFQTALFDVTIDPKGNILSYTRAGEFTDNLGYDNFANHIAEVFDINNRQLSAPATWHNTTVSTSWFSDIMKAFGAEWFLDPSAPIPEISQVEPLAKDIWKRSFAYLLGTREIVNYAPVEDPQAVFSGTRYVTETRIFLSEPALLVSAIVLAIYLIVAAILYGFSIRFFLPRMPTTIAAILEFMGPSRALQDCGPDAGSLLRFGRYIGRDGKKHVGIEYAEFVMPVEQASSEASRITGHFRRRWTEKR